MLILGLTGSIGMGKSAAAEHLRRRHIPVLDSDAVVHRLYEGPLCEKVDAAFPGTVVGGIVDRARLSLALANDPSGFARLEAIVHPAVREAQRIFLDLARRRGVRVAVLEVPLLFETKTDRLVDATMVVSAGPEVQMQRVLARPGMTPQKLELILSRQISDAEKRELADFIVDTSGPIEDSRAQIDEILAELPRWPTGAFDRHWAGRAA